MKMSRISTRLSGVVLACLIVFIMLMLAINPSVYMQSCLDGIYIWGQSVLPALFPFFFFSGLLTRLKILDILGQKLSKMMQKLFHTSGSSGIIYILSIVSGYPVGAKITSELYKSGAIDRDEVVRINAFASTSGPLFIIGAVGVGMFHSRILGLILLISHILGALLNGLLYRNYHSNSTNCINIQKIPNLNESISSNLYDSIVSIMIVGGYIVIANILIDMMCNLGILSTISNFLNYIMSLLGCDYNLGTGICSGVFEITRGCKDLSFSNGVPIQVIASLVCGIISWGGISIHLQALTFLQKCQISTKFYMLQKFTQAVISSLVCFVFCLIFF